MRCPPETTFDYELPRERIAQFPAAASGGRERARLLCYERRAERRSIVDKIFSDLPALLNRGDVLVLNNSRVIPVRFFGRKAEGGSEVEILLLRRCAVHETAVHESAVHENSVLRNDVWEALARPMRKLRLAERVHLSPRISGVVLGRTECGGKLLLQLEVRRASQFDDGSGAAASPDCRLLIEEDGSMPLPPYIRDGRAELADREFYQTVFASQPGSLAAPTAGLHFTAALLGELNELGVEAAYLTLHVGEASFLSEERQAAGVAAETFNIPSETISAVLQAKKHGCRVIAVGTTSVRALETWGAAPEQFAAGRTHATALHIIPGFRFRVVDALLTNFHQPGTTHLSLVSAFAGINVVSQMYEHALRNGYRFLSYGDAMFIS